MEDFIFNKSWVKIEYAAKYLSNRMHQKIRVCDVFDLAVQGKINIYAHFSKQIPLIPCELEVQDFYIGLDADKAKENPFSLGFFRTTEPIDSKGRQRLRLLTGVRYEGKILKVQEPKIIKGEDGLNVVLSRYSHVVGLQDLLPIAGFMNLLKDLAYGEDHHDNNCDFENFFYIKMGSGFYVVAERTKVKDDIEGEYVPTTNLLAYAELVVKPTDLKMLFDSNETMQKEISSDPESNITTLQAIGIMAELLAEVEGCHKYRKGEKNVNANAIGVAVAARAKMRFGDDIRGFDSFNKKISEGLKALEKLEKK